VTGIREKKGIKKNKKKGSIQEKSGVNEEVVFPNEPLCE